MRAAFVKTASFFLLVCILLHTTGLYFAFYIYQQEVKKEMRKYLANDLNHQSISSFTYTTDNAAEFIFEGKDEFTYHGRMYDVIKTEKIESKTIIYCVDDKKETALVHSFLKKQTTDKSSKTKLQNTGQFLTLLYITSKLTELNENLGQILRHNSLCLCCYPQNNLDVLQPPPQVLA